MTSRFKRQQRKTISINIRTGFEVGFVKMKIEILKSAYFPTQIEQSIEEMLYLYLAITDLL